MTDDTSRIRFDVPFYSNTPDDLQCVPSVFGMVLEYFLKRKQSREELIRLTGFNGKGCWFFPALTKLKQQGFEIEVMDNFDYERCFEDKEEYLRNYFKNPQALRYALEKSDLMDKVDLLPEFVKTIKPRRGVPQIKDIEQYLNRGCLVAVELDSGVLGGIDEYYSHLVLVIGFDEDNLVIHDPGLPPFENRVVSKELFERAWSYEGQNSHNLTAFKL